MNNRPAGVIDTALNVLERDYAWLADETGLEEDALREQIAGEMTMDVVSASVIAEVLDLDLPTMVTDLRPLRAEVEVAA